MKVQYLDTILKNKIARFARKNAHEQHGVQNGSFKIQWLKGLFGLRSQRPSSSFYCSSEQFYLGEIESSWISATAGLCVASVRLWVWFKTVNQVMSMLLRLEECCNLTLEIDAIPQHQTQLHSVWNSAKKSHVIFFCPKWTIFGIFDGLLSNQN